MAKKKRITSNFQTNAPQNSAARLSSVPVDMGSIGKKGGWILGISFFLVVSGYILLRHVDPAGQNVYAFLSPALLLSGYLLIFFSL